MSRDHLQLKQVASLVSLVVLATVVSCRGVGATSTPKNDHEDEDEPILPEDQMGTAYHEAAHAVVCMALFPECVVFGVRAYTVVNDHNWGSTTMQHGSLSNATYKHRANAVLLKAGAAADEIFIQAPSPKTDSDTKKAKLAIVRHCRSARATARPCECPQASRVHGRCTMIGWIKSEYDRVYEDAKACVRANHGVIMDLAEQIMVKEEADGRRQLAQDELRAFFAKHEINSETCRRRIR